MMDPDRNPLAVAGASELSARILTAMQGLGREPDLSRIVQKAGLPTEALGREVILTPESVEAFNGLIRRGKIRSGSRGGWRLVGR
jgi:hypothetical protein